MSKFVAELRYGVMVALQILVLPVQVRVLVSQQKKVGVFRPFFAEIIPVPRKLRFHPQGYFDLAVGPCGTY